MLGKRKEKQDRESNHGRNSRRPHAKLYLPAMPDVSLPRQLAQVAVLQGVRGAEGVAVRGCAIRRYVVQYQPRCLEVSVGDFVLSKSHGKFPRVDFPPRDMGNLVHPTKAYLAS